MHPAMQRRRHRLMLRRTASRGRPRRGLATFLLGTLAAIGLMLGGSLVGTGGGMLAAYNYFASGLPDPRILDDVELPQSTYVYDRTGKTLLARFECQNREAVAFDQIPDALVNATVAIEDRTFWENSGIDVPGIARAAIANLEAGDIVQGASTITQQVIKYADSIKQAQQKVAPSGAPHASAELDPSAEPQQSEADICQPPDLSFLQGRTFEDKIREAILATKVTDAYPGRAGKERILDTYMNLINYGNGSYGIKSAAANYFGITDLSKLSLAQSAFLAGLPQAPGIYDPYLNNHGPDRAIQRRNQVLDAMLVQKYITKAQHDAARKVTWEEMKPSRISSPLREPHFTFRVRDEAESILASLGYKNPAQLVRTGGFRITTTIDMGLQDQAHKQVAKWVKALNNKNVNNRALVAINSATGEIVAYIGSVDYYNRKDPRVDGQFDVAGLGRRQPGSAFKPITYSSAFKAREATPATFFLDNTTQFGATPKTAYVPTNADIIDHGPLLATDAIRYSLNVPSVMMQYLVGEETTAKFAESMGIASEKYINDLQPGLTLTLGSVPVNLTNMTQAYGVFAQQGALHPATTIREIRDRNNRIVYSLDSSGPQVTHPLTADESYLMHWILEGNTNPRTNVVWGSRAELNAPNGERRHAGFKTGTTNDFRDVSGFGYVPGGLVTGVWMGNNNQEPMSTSFGGLFSADGPLYLWHDFMTIALNKPWDWNGQKAVPVRDIAQPAGVVDVNVCKFSGMRATGNCGPTREIPVLKGTEPPPDNVHQNGCFDVVKEVNQDSRRPKEWVESAQKWADRVVNGETGAVGDPTKIKEQFDKVRLRIAPVPGNNSYGSPICGVVRATPTPQVTEAPPPGGGGPSPGSEPPKPSPSGDCKNPNKPGCASTPPTPAAALLLSITGLLAPIVELRRRRMRRRAA
jgi:membrane peptidoglycan carboxypeptidase